VPRTRVEEQRPWQAKNANKASARLCKAVGAQSEEVASTKGWERKRFEDGNDGGGRVKYEMSGGGKPGQHSGRQ